MNPFSQGAERAGAIEEAIAVANTFYKDLLEDGVKPEDARAVLPNACCTELYLTANARTLIEISHLRLCNRAQGEVRELFDRLKQCVALVCPEVAAKMVPACEKYEGYPFCTEEKSCGRHQTLAQVHMSGDEDSDDYDPIDI